MFFYVLNIILTFLKHVFFINNMNVCILRELSTEWLTLGGHHLVNGC